MWPSSFGNQRPESGRSCYQLISHERNYLNDLDHYSHSITLVQNSLQTVAHDLQCFGQILIHYDPRYMHPDANRYPRAHLHRQYSFCDSSRVTKAKSACIILQLNSILILQLNCGRKRQPAHLQRMLYTSDENNSWAQSVKSSTLGERSELQDDQTNEDRIAVVAEQLSRLRPPTQLTRSNRPAVAGIGNICPRYGDNLLVASSNHDHETLRDVVTAVACLQTTCWLSTCLRQKEPHTERTAWTSDRPVYRHFQMPDCSCPGCGRWTNRNSSGRCTSNVPFQKH